MIGDVDRTGQMWYGGFNKMEVKIMNDLSYIHNANREGGKLCSQCNDYGELSVDKRAVSYRVKVDGVMDKFTWIYPTERARLCFYHRRKKSGEVTTGWGPQARVRPLPGRMGL